MGTIIQSGSFRTFNAKACIYELEPSLHQYIGMQKEIITLNIIIPCDWVGAMRNLWTTPAHDCPCNASNTSASNTGPYNYPCDSNILLHAANTPSYNIDETFPRGDNNEFVERYRNDIFRLFYNENPSAAQQWEQHIQDMVDNTNPFRFVTEEERNNREETITEEGHHCDPELYHGYTVSLAKVENDLQYVPNVNHLDHIWYSPTNSLGTNSLGKLINNINVGEILDLLWNYFYHDYTACEDDHAFDPYNTLALDDELVFPVHVLSIFGYSDKVTMLTMKDDILYDYHVNIRFKQNVVPEVGDYVIQDTVKTIIGEDIPPN